MSTSVKAPVLSLNTAKIYISRADKAIQEGRPWDAICELLPRRNNQDALKLLARAYCHCGQQGAALTTLSFLHVHDPQLEAEILTGTVK